MLKTKPNIPAPIAATSETNYWNDFKKWEDQAVKIDLKALKAMSMRDLRVLSSGIDTISQVAQAITCQPRCHTDSDGSVYSMNGAGVVIDGIVDFLGFYRDTVLRVLRASKPDDADEIEARAWAIVGYEADMGDCMLDLAATVAGENKAITRAKLGKARRA